MSTPSSSGPSRADAAYDCGHFVVQQGCGGCDPGAIEFVIEDGQPMRAYDAARDLNLNPHAGCEPTMGCAAPIADFLPDCTGPITGWCVVANCNRWAGIASTHCARHKPFNRAR